MGGSPTLTATRLYSAGVRLSSITDWLSNQTLFNYDAVGNLKGIVYPNSSQAAFAYDAANRLTSVTQGISVTTYFSSTYTRGGLGLLLSSVESGSSTQGYNYDALNRLTAALLGGASPVTRTWGYDAAHQITQSGVQVGVASSVTVTNRTYDPANELTGLVEQQGVTTTRTLTYTYNLNGGRTTQASSPGTPLTYTFDLAGRMSGFSNGASPYTYSYNGDGLRMVKNGGSPEYYAWDLSGNLPDLLQDGTASYIYGPNGMPIEEVTGASAYYYHTDQLGSVRALSDAAGTKVASYSYDPYGVPLSVGGAVYNPLRYAGEYADAESGLVYLRARYYDPATQQFLSPDPLVVRSNRPYVYANSSPLSFTDPSGLLAFAVAGGVSIAVALACAGGFR